MTSHPGTKGGFETAFKKSPCSARKAARLRAGREHGFTLTELLTVIAILAILGGLSAKVFQVARQNFSLAASASQVEALLLRARNTAISAGVPVRVEVNPHRDYKTVTAYAFETLGEWSFESDRGLFNDPLAFNGAGFVPGHVGNGVKIGGGNHVNCGASPRFDVRIGLHVEAWIVLERSLAAPQRQTSSGTGTRRSTRRAPRPVPMDVDVEAVIAKGKAFFLGITPAGAMEGGIGEYRVRTRPGIIHPGIWTKVAMRYDGGEVLLIADGIEREAVPIGFEGLKKKQYPVPPKVIPLDPGPLTIGSSKGSFPGRVDEARLRGMIEPEEYRLAPREYILGWKKIIHFDRRGHLDPRFHEKPVRILLYNKPKADEPSSRTGVVVDYSKTWEEYARSRGVDIEKENLSEEVEEKRLEDKLVTELREEIIVDRIGSVR